jgi:hypothetical protein
MLLLLKLLLLGARAGRSLPQAAQLLLAQLDVLCCRYPSDGALLAAFPTVSICAGFSG